MTSQVYLIDTRATVQDNFAAKIERLMNAAGISDVVGKRNLTAVKMHFGEMGNTAFIRPVYIRRVVEVIKQAGGVPFLTDANTLYAGTRSDSPRHLTTAVANGFAYAVVQAPLIIADGLRGKNETPIAIHQKQFESVYIARDIVEADALISVAHFKGHELTGFGGTLKNLGMGCASRKGKLAQHSGLSPTICDEKCIGCGQCLDHCSQQAISIEDEKSRISPDTCIGCGECILICPNEAIEVQWEASIPVLMERMVEYAMGVLMEKKQRRLFINFITDVSPACDCCSANDAPIVRNIGVVAATDPVAVDQASVDLVNAEPALAGSLITTNLDPGEDKFKGIYPEVDWAFQLDYAEQLGLGSRRYELVKL